MTGVTRKQAFVKLANINWQTWQNLYQRWFDRLQPLLQHFDYSHSACSCYVWPLTILWLLRIDLPYLTAALTRASNSMETEPIRCPIVSFHCYFNDASLLLPIRLYLFLHMQLRFLMRQYSSNCKRKLEKHDQHVVNKTSRLTREFHMQRFSINFIVFASLPFVLQVQQEHRRWKKLHRIN